MDNWSFNCRKVGDERVNGVKAKESNESSGVIRELHFYTNVGV